METGKKVSKTMPRAKSSRLFVLCDCMIEKINLLDSYLKRFYSFFSDTPDDERRV